MAPRPLPSFSKVLLDPSAPCLPLPHAFVRKHLEDKIPESPILRSVNGGYSWRLKIKKLGENYCFVNGWSDVVGDSGLEFGDFLVFWLVDPSTFKLSIFSPSGCEKDFPVENDDVNEEEEEEEKEEEEKEEEEEEDEYEEEEEEIEEEEDGDIYDDGGRRGGNHNVEEDDGDEDDDVGGDVDGDEGDPLFMTTISKSHKCSMRLPVKFARWAGLDAARTISMKNVDGKEWPMRLLSESRRYERYYLSAGWSDFRRVNQLSEGDVCSLKFIRSEDKLCLAKVTKKRVPANQPAVKVPATEVKKSIRGKVPAAEVSRKKRGRASRVEVERKGDGAKAVKRPRERPFKRTRGRPAAISNFEKV
ncbi:hypothetical protein L2E82_13573 [Cichorium intybus]|uniref:Uncharacterized protein n=1 Tax=Cichorium intybus TaxID=13427 RepID=A0ACB9EXC1_CICIN|nr:hypothetical protein L2E82_13573 [Cichorium intybus]